MPQIGVSIVKSCVFRDSVQEFSNTYHYASPPGTTQNTSDLEGIVDEIVTWEKLRHSTKVTFVRARVWSSGGTIAQNTMLFEKNLSGTGSSSTSTNFDHERAYLIQWSAGKDVRGNKVYLRKWYHSCGFFAGHSLTATVLTQESGFSTTDRAAIAAAADTITRVGPLEAWGLVAASGRERDGGAPTAHKYLEHHQLGDMWR